MSVWKTLSSINVNDKKEEKMGLSYLSWAWAWGELKSKYPSASYQIHDDIIYPDSTVEVRVTVTVEDQDHMMWLPVMDNRNKAISGPTSRQISDARMRCLAKAIAMHGLGHYIFAGEDIPQSDGEAPQSEEKENPKPTPQKKEKAPEPPSEEKVQLNKDEELLGYMINTGAYREEDRKPRAIYEWDSWATVTISWINAIKHEKTLNSLYVRNKEMFERAKEEAFSKYEEVGQVISAKKAELKEKK
jgi:hypothetical protein